MHKKQASNLDVHLTVLKQVCLVSYSTVIITTFQPRPQIPNNKYTQKYCYEPVKDTGFMTYAHKKQSNRRNWYQI